MAILVISEVAGQTSDGYDSVRQMVEPAMKQSPGFIVHVAHADESCWRLLEVWQSKAEADGFYAKSVAPYLPPGVKPKRRYQELHSLIHV